MEDSGLSLEMLKTTLSKVLNNQARNCTRWLPVAPFNPNFYKIPLNVKKNC